MESFFGWNYWSTEEVFFGTKHSSCQIHCSTDIHRKTQSHNQLWSYPQNVVSHVSQRLKIRICQRYLPHTMVPTNGKHDLLGPQIMSLSQMSPLVFDHTITTLRDDSYTGKNKDLAIRSGCIFSQNLGDLSLATIFFWTSCTSSANWQLH